MKQKTIRKHKIRFDYEFNHGEWAALKVCASRMDKTVRRHIKWNTWLPDLREDLAHLVQDIKRRVCGIASAGSPWFSV